MFFGLTQEIVSAKIARLAVLDHVIRHGARAEVSGKPLGKRLENALNKVSGENVSYTIVPGKDCAIMYVNRPTGTHQFTFPLEWNYEEIQNITKANEDRKIVAAWEKWNSEEGLGDRMNVRSQEDEIENLLARIEDLNRQKNEILSKYL